MDIKKKVRHILYYYKWHILIALAAVLCVVSLARTYFDNRAERCITVAIVNCGDTEPLRTTLTGLYGERSEIDLAKTPIAIEGGFSQPADLTTTMDTTVAAGLQRYAAMLTNGVFDLAVSPTWSVDLFSASDGYVDLRQLFSEETLALWAPCLYYAPQSDGEEIPVGVILSDTSPLGVFTEGTVPVLSVSRYSEKPEEAAFVIEALMAETESAMS